VFTLRDVVRYQTSPLHSSWEQLNRRYHTPPQSRAALQWLGEFTPVLYRLFLAVKCKYNAIHKTGSTSTQLCILPSTSFNWLQ